MTLGQIELVLCDFWVELGQLFIDSRGIQEVLAHVIAIGKKGHGSASRAKLKFITKVINGLNDQLITS